MAKVSIIIPIYNVEKYLRECLDSVINQTLKDIEIICVNDGSTDSSLEIIEEYASKDNRIKIIHKQNSGYGASMNMGLKAATSDYIGIVESDDIAKPEMFEELYNLITKNECEIAKSNFYLYFSSPHKLIQENIIKDKIANKVTNAKETNCIFDFPPSIWSALYKREFLTKNNIKFLETPGASYQDTGFYIKSMMMANRVIFTTNAYLYYRQDNECSSVKSKGKVYCVSDEFKEIHHFINEHPELNYFNSIIYAIHFSRYHWNLTRIDKSFHNEFIDFMYKEFQKYYNNGDLDSTTLHLINKHYNFKLFLKTPQKYFNKYFKQRKLDKLKTRFTQIRKKVLQIRLNKKEKLIKILEKTICGGGNA